MVIYSNVFSQCAMEINLKKRGKRVKKGAFDRKKCTQL